MAESTIYTGLWMNWSKGPVLGATLTMSSQHGFLLVSFLALFVRMVSGHFWSILCFVMHQIQSDSSPQDGLHHQHQLLLRNSQSHTSTLWDLIKVSVYWKSSAKRSCWRTLPLILTALCHLVLFTAAGLFSSRIASSSDEVLVRKNSNCGYLMFPTTTGAYTQAQYQQLADVFINIRTTDTWALNYAKTCYVDGSGPSTGCNTFATPDIVFTANLGECPFQSEMCLDPTTGALQIDTGFINSDIHLGINSRQDHSVDYRKVTTCAPLVTKGFTEWHNGSDLAIPDDQFLDYYYGEYLGPDGNTTWTWDFDYYEYNETQNAYYLDYRYSALADLSSSNFIPIDALNRTDADVTLVFLTNFARYPTPVTDPFFFAETAYNDGTKSSNLYTADPPVSVMGCTEQHQLRDPFTGNTSPLTGSIVLGAMDQFSGEQLSIVRHIYRAIDSNFLNNMVFSLGSMALQAEFNLDGAQALLSSGLPPDQWITEVTSWSAYMMAHLQRMIYDFAAGPSDPSFDQYVQPPAAEDQERFDVCANQKIRDAHFYSFNVFGLFVTLFVGCAIVVLNLGLSTIVGLVQKFSKKGLHKREDWGLDHSLQVQRLAYENAGLGTWKGKDSLVPTTKLGERFGKPTRAAGASTTSPLFSPESVDTLGLEAQEGYPFIKAEQGMGFTVTERHEVGR